MCPVCFVTHVPGRTGLLGGVEVIDPHCVFAADVRALTHTR